MEEKAEAEKSVPFSLAYTVSYSGGSVVSKTLLKKDVGNITLFPFDSGQVLTEHTSPFDAVVYIMDGEAEITIGGKVQIVTAGKMMIMLANIPHGLQAIKRFKMMLIMIRGS